MPSEANLRRLALGDMMPAYPGGGYGDGGSRLIDLIMERGRVGSESALRSGEIWGSAVQNLGQTISGQIQANQMAKRDAAATKALESWDGRDPRELHAALSMYDPQKRMEMVKGAIALRDLGDAADEKDEARFERVLKTAAELPYPMFARFYPAMHGKMSAGAQRFRGIPADQIPAEPSQEIYQTVRRLAGVKEPTAEGFTLGPGQQRFDASGKPVASVAPNVPEPKKYPVTVPGPGGRPTSRLATEEEMAAGVPVYREPPQARQQNWREAEDAEGNPVLVDYETGQTKPYPGGAMPKPGAAEANRIAAADAALSSSAEVKSYLEKPEVRAAIGPIMGRWNSLTQAAGSGDPVAVQLVGMLKSYSALQPQIHGFRNVHFAHDIEKLLTTKQTPETLEAALRGIDSAAVNVRDRRRDGMAQPAKARGPKGGEAKHIASDAEFEALASGTQFIGPDGVLRRKP